MTTTLTPAQADALAVGMDRLCTALEANTAMYGQLQQLLTEVVNNQRAEAALRLMDRGGNPFATAPGATQQQPGIVHPPQQPYQPQQQPGQPVGVQLAWNREMKDGSGVTHAGRMLLPGGEGTLIYQRRVNGAFTLSVENRQGLRTEYVPKAADVAPADPNRNVGVTGFDGPNTTARNREE